MAIDHVIVIGGWEDVKGHDIRLQDFIINGESFIPIFVDEATFKREAAGSGFEDQGVSIDRNLLISILSDDQMLLLNPGSDSLRMRRADLARGLQAVLAAPRK
ncbi:hypothetical protein [Mesorhizobium sp. B2-3-4]|uniref:hypothetical protein n=1 Tax=Mesorhizobium sp. B2-3-4 TaxID=2589959 RepID=UPI00112DC82D|nr:hypothetical protein [Mesorhizobium sp. B2-3-4]TPM38134.1 hypothetical protein FJ967_12740 [Mesorhizobium sp. B2-3-4]